MEDYRMIIAGLIGSVITIFIRVIIDIFTERAKYKRELRKLVFQRKTDTVEKAISWYQEAIECWIMMQGAYSDINTKYNPITMTKLYTSLIQAAKLHEETSDRLNQIYLYYDFSDIEKNFGARESMELISNSITRIGELVQEYHSLKALGKDDNCSEIQKLRTETLSLLKWMPQAIDKQISHIIEIQNKLRQEYKDYLK